MDSLQTECSECERIDGFLSNRLDAVRRHSFVAHLGVCEHCSSLLRDLREDERLSRIPLSPEERRRVDAIVRTVRTELTVHLEEDYRRREHRAEEIEALSSPLLSSPTLTLLRPGLRRVFLLAALAAALLAGALWFRMS